jgi:2-keto-3-deoxy-L-rhamnonate aldolase RhmA
MTQLGHDFLVLDMQHSEITMAQIPALLGAFCQSGPFAVVRAPKNEYHAINWLLDQGVDGVLAPMVNSPEAARDAVMAAKYPPVGRRSFGPFRAARYGSQLESYVSHADQGTALIIQVEDAHAALHIDDIINVGGFDAIFMGPNDLAYSMLKPGQTIKGDSKQWSAFARTPEVIELCEHVMRRSIAAGLPFGMTAASMDDAQAWLAKGSTFVTCGSDFVFLRAGHQSLTGAKSERA